MTKKTMLVLREQMRKTKQTSPIINQWISYFPTPDRGSNIHTHKHQKERKARIKLRRLQPRRVSRLSHRSSRSSRIGHVRTIRIVIGLQGCTEGEPEGAKGAENDEGEGVADDPFADGANDHEEAAEEEVCAWGFLLVDWLHVFGLGDIGAEEVGESHAPISEAPLPPAPRQPMSWHERGERERMKPTRALQWRQRGETSEMMGRKLTLALGYQMSSSVHR